MEDQPEYDGHKSYASGYIARERAEQRIVKVPLDYVDMMNGNVYAAMLLAQIVYWHGADSEGKSRLKVKRDGHWWLAKEYKDWWDECRIREGTARKHIDQMVKSGILIRKHFRFGGMRTTHLRIDWKIFKEKLAEVQDVNAPPVSYNVADRNATTYPTGTLQRSGPLTETTTENTTTRADDAAGCDFDDLPTMHDNTEFITGEKPNGRKAQDDLQVMARPVYAVLLSTGINPTSAIKAARWIPASVAFGSVFQWLSRQVEETVANGHLRGLFAQQITNPTMKPPPKFVTLAKLDEARRHDLTLYVRAIQAHPEQQEHPPAKWVGASQKTVDLFLSICTRGSNRDPTKHYAWRDDSALWPAVEAWAGEDAWTEDVNAWIESKRQEVTA